MDDCEHFMVETLPVKCPHCDKSFCQICALAHVERLKVEIEWALARLEFHIDRPKRSKLDKLIHRIRIELRRFAGAEPGIEDVEYTIAEGIDRVPDLQEALHVVRDKVKKLQSATSFYSTLNTVADVHQIALKKECLVTVAIETMINTALGMGDISDFDKTKEDVDVLPNRMHIKARRGSIIGLRELFDLPNLSPTCKQFMIEHVDVSDENRTVLHQTCQGGHLEATRYLVEELAAEVEQFSSDGKQPIHLAAENGHLDVVEYLVESFPELLTAQTSEGKTSLTLALQNKHIDLAKYLNMKESESAMR